MNEPDFTRTSLTLSEAEITIIGLGLMGGSLAQALRGKCRRLTGYDPDPETCTYAGQQNFVDRVTADPTAALSGAQIVILAAPIQGILAWIDRLANYPHPAFIIDIGSTKVEICQALKGLPPNLAAVGGHPMCGKERAGIAHADPTLFQDAPFSFVRLPNSTTASCQVAESVAYAVGAHPVWIDAETHDRWTAATSHVPYLVASALTRATPLEASPLIGPGFRSTARLAGSSPGMMLDILESNRSSILEALRQVRAQIDELDIILENGEMASLRRWLVEVQGQYALLLD